MNAPTYPAELVIRPITGEADLPAMAAVALRCNQADQVDEVVTVEGLTAWFRHLINSTPEDDVLLAEVAGQLVGYQFTAWRHETSGAYIYNLSGYLDPDYRRRGLGTLLVERGEARLRAVAALQPAGVQRSFQTFSAATREGKLALFERSGYRIERHFFDMLNSDPGAVAPAPLPAGLELRPADRQDQAQLHTIWRAVEEAFRDHWGNVEFGDAYFLRLMDSPDTNPDLWQVAWDTATGEVAGAAVNIIPTAENAEHGRQRAWVDELGVRRPYRQRGLGRALLLNSLHALGARGLTEVGLSVDAENPTGALGLYESVGFKTFQHSMALRKPL